MLRPMSRQDIFYSGSIANLREFKSQASMLSYRESALNLQGTGASRAVLDALDGPDDSEGGVILHKSFQFFVHPHNKVTLKVS